MYKKSVFAALSATAVLLAGGAAAVLLTGGGAAAAAHVSVSDAGNVPQAHPLTGLMRKAETSFTMNQLVPAGYGTARVSAGTAGDVALETVHAQPGSLVLGSGLAYLRSPGTAERLVWVVSVDEAGGQYEGGGAGDTLADYVVVYVNAQTGQMIEWQNGYDPSLPVLPWIPEPGSTATAPPQWAYVHGTSNEDVPRPHHPQPQRTVTQAHPSS